MLSEMAGVLAGGTGGTPSVAYVVVDSILNLNGYVSSTYPIELYWLIRIASVVIAVKPKPVGKKVDGDVTF
jgi:hypothetical protein